MRPPQTAMDSTARGDMASLSTLAKTKTIQSHLKSQFLRW